ncbi:hypothetical protein JTE90_018971 [Oedothorax gibbosus]|uniref:Uncharacterized protein n=1 Tax=Oedothorax gibbosus TaxID=931172 RepID=A0AAV6V0V5_9ARAC|nr:hypothetical protein JTE90_018971 [Oedothorax gibbosus]
MESAAEDPKRIIEEKDKLIKRQFIRIEELESELTAVKEERDGLLCDVNKLRFELEMSELKRLKDYRKTADHNPYKVVKEYAKIKFFPPTSLPEESTSTSCGTFEHFLQLVFIAPFPKAQFLTRINVSPDNVSSHPVDSFSS